MPDSFVERCFCCCRKKDTKLIDAEIEAVKPNTKNENTKEGILSNMEKQNTNYASHNILAEVRSYLLSFNCLLLLDISCFNVLNFLILF